MTAPSDLVDRLYETSVEPERLFDLIREWDARIGGDPEIALRDEGLTSAAFVRHVERALAVLDEVHAFEFRRLDDVLAGIPMPAAVLTDTGTVVAANDPARTVFGLFPSGSIRLLPVGRAELDDLCDRVAGVALAPRPRDEIVPLRPGGRERPVLVHLRTLDTGRCRRHALAVSSEPGWIDAVGDLLARVFHLTGAEVEIVRLLTVGEKVADICRATGRTEGTVRSQLHAILSKTGTRSQIELLRLTHMLLHSVAFDPGRARPAAALTSLALDPRRRQVRLADGRRLTVMRFGDPAGRPVIWQQSMVGLFHPTTSGERELMRRGIRLVVPVRAGFGSSDPAPPGRDVLEVAVADLLELMGMAGIDRCPIVAPIYDIRATLMLARAAPDRVERIVGVGCAFPIRSMEQFRRHHTVARVFLACARYAPQVFPFLARASYTQIVRIGLDEYLRGNFRETPSDARAFAIPEIAAAVTAGFTTVHDTGPAAVAAFSTEVIRCQQPWPPGLGDVACPVTLVHGEEDGVASHLTALDYCAMHPRWRYVGFPDEGQLVGLARWREVLDLIEAGLDPLPESSAAAPSLAAP